MPPHDNTALRDTHFVKPRALRRARCGTGREEASETDNTFSDIIALETGPSPEALAAVVTHPLGAFSSVGALALTYTA